MIRGLLTLLVLGAVLGAALPASGAAQSSNPFQRLVGREAEPRAAALWYERADGRGRFVFDRSTQPALMLAENGSEVIALYPARASGGGEVWQTDTGRVVLRFSNLGGATYFPQGNSEGVIADPVGEAPPVRAEPASARDLERAAGTMIEDLAAIARHQVSAELTEVGPEANPYIIDAMRMVVIAADETGRRNLRDLDIVRIGVGERPRAVYAGGVLDISVNPSAGYGGRPSSAYIRQEFERGR